MQNSFKTNMGKKITKEEAKAFKTRWERINEAERQELRGTSPIQKLNQLATLMDWVKDFGWNEVLKAEETEVRNRWIKLKKFCHV